MTIALDFPLFALATVDGQVQTFTLTHDPEHHVEILCNGHPVPLATFATLRPHVQFNATSVINVRFPRRSLVPFHVLQTCNFRFQSGKIWLDHLPIGYDLSPSPDRIKVVTRIYSMPKRKRTVKLTVKRKRWVCDICEDVENCEVTTPNLLNPQWCTKHTLVRFCDRHVYCLACIVRQFAETHRLPSCATCHGDPIPLEQAIELFASVEASTDKLFTRYQIHHHNTTSACGCQEGCPHRGTIDRQRGLIRFADYQQHQDLCWHCWQPQHGGPCGAVWGKLVPVFRAFGGRSLWRNCQISAAQLRWFVDQLVTSPTPPVYCPGCMIPFHKTGDCNELTCQTCGFKLCYFCGEAHYGKAMLDHFALSSDGSLYSPCPRYDHQLTLRDDDGNVMQNQCTVACAGDHCPHTQWRARYHFRRKCLTLCKLLSKLDQKRTMVVLNRLFHHNFHLPDELTINI